MKTRVIVLGVSRYQFPDQKSGEMIEGSKVHYIEDSAADEENVAGHTPQTANMKYGYFDQMYAAGVPAVYEANLKVDLTGKKPTLKIEGFDFVAPFSFKQLVK